MLFTVVLAIMAGRPQDEVKLYGMIDNEDVEKQYQYIREYYGGRN
jgi:hypothetical protein